MKEQPNDLKYLATLIAVQHIWIDKPQRAFFFILSPKEDEIKSFSA